MNTPAVTRLRTGLTDLGVSEDEIERTVPLFLRYLADLERGARRYGLISREDASSPERLLHRHLLDSLLPWRIVRDRLSEGRRTLYDIGSGAGLPGIPLAILLRSAIDACVLVERRIKRTRFLEAAAAALPEIPLRVFADEVERLVSPGTEAIPGALVLFRAWTPADAAMSAVLRRTFTGGTPVVMYKGPRANADGEAQILVATNDYEDISVQTLSEQRTIILATIRSS